MKKLLIILLGKLIRLIEKPWTLLDLLKKRMTMMRIEIEDTTVNGTFNMMFLGYSVSLGYKNHRNIIMRISSVGSQDNDPSVLVNGHFDSPLGSPGAGDCGSCVASMLEIARLTVDSGWVPPRPIIFLFNGAEELFMLIFYSRKQAVVLHSIPVAIYLFMPFLLRLANVGLSCSIATFYDFIKGMLVHATGIILAVLFPVICAILRLLVTGHSMNWFAHPFLAFMMFVPGSLVGLLIPRIVWRCFPLSQDVSVLKASREELADEARFWGAFGFYAVLTAAYLVAGLSGGFLTFSSSLFMLPAWICFCLSLKSFGRQSLRSIACYVVPLIPCLAYSVYFGGFIAQFLIEKMGMMGSLPPPHGKQY